LQQHLLRRSPLVGADQPVPSDLSALYKVLGHKIAALIQNQDQTVPLRSLEMKGLRMRGFFH
jgi:hypothetical protein